MKERQGLWQRLVYIWQDRNFLKLLKHLESLVSKILSIAMIVVIFVTIIELVSYLAYHLFTPPYGRFNNTLLEIFGMFLNVLIALEILENITAYLRKHLIQVELVIVTSLIAMARKIIIFDLEQKKAIDLIALASAVLALSASYWVVRYVNHRRSH